MDDSPIKREETFKKLDFSPQVESEVGMSNFLEEDLELLKMLQIHVLTADK